ncbi:MAG: Nif3-like dinuclear metal center hexameric protein [Paludibacteraceae bacterium]|nr:Nif3-like dinuclear metal center hexameric protein [Paludibacteraceae bacterium]
MTANEVINIIESVAPLSQQEGWDNSGLQVGQRATVVTRVLLCTDLTEAVLDEAQRKGCEMIVSHHPLLFHGLKTVEGLTPQERCVIQAIRHNIVLYSSHTAMDTWLHGVSGRMADKLGITDYQILSSTGEGTGLGVIGTLPTPMTEEELLALVKRTFRVPAVRYVSGACRPVSRIAMCGGAGSEFAQEAFRQGAEAYLSADFKYHEMQAWENRLLVMDIGHFESEQYTKEVFRDLLAGRVDCLFAETDRSPVRYF